MQIYFGRRQKSECFLWTVGYLKLYDESTCSESGTKTKLKAINKIPRTIAQVTIILSQPRFKCLCSKSMTMQIKELLVRKALISSHNLLFKQLRNNIDNFFHANNTRGKVIWSLKIVLLQLLHIILRDGEEK